MKIAFVLIGLHSLFSISVFGIVFNLTKGTRAANLAPVAAGALWPALYIAALSVLGYVKAQNFHEPLALALIAAGLIWTIFVIAGNRSQIKTIDWPASLAIHGVSIFAGLLTVIPHIWNNDYGYSEFSNGEFLNYAQLASFSLGHQQSTLPVRWEVAHQGLRDGIDFIDAIVSLFTQQEPANIVQLTAALMRMAYFAALLFVIRNVFSSRTYAVLGTLLIGILFAFWNFDQFQFEISFMAMVLSLSIALSILTLTSTTILGMPQATALYAALNIALLVSYPETMIMLKCLEIVFIAENWVKNGRNQIINRWLLGNALTVAINPLLVLHKVAYAYEATNGLGGWNIAEPLHDWSTYVARIIGIEPIYLSDLALTHHVTVIVGVALIVLTFELYFIYRLSQLTGAYAVLLVPAMVVVLHVLPLLDHRSFYAAAKVMVAWLWIVPLGLAASYAAASKPERIVLVAAMSIFFVANVETFRRGETALLAMDSFKSAKESGEIVRIAKANIGENGALSLDSDDPVFAQYWLHIMDSNGVKTSLTTLQLEYFARDAPQNYAPEPPSSVKVRLKPKFAFAWKMPRTDLVWNPIPRASEPELYSSHLVALSKMAVD